MKITNDVKDQVVAFYNNGLTQYDIAQELSIGRRSVYRILQERCVQRRSLIVTRQFDDITQRKCPRCNKWKDKQDFYNNTSSRTGLSTYCKECCKLYHKNERKDWGRKRRRLLRQEMVAAYGGVCECCGENNWEFLTIDHINGDGREHRKKIGRTDIYLWLKKRGWPKDSYRLLCFNCNSSFGLLGYCPHQHKGDGNEK